MMIDIDDEELEALIEFQRSMRDGAEESLEVEEVKTRRKRIAELILLKDNLRELQENRALK